VNTILLGWYSRGTGEGLGNRTLTTLRPGVGVGEKDGDELGKGEGKEVGVG
jgi:hypothetical protein